MLGAPRADEAASVRPGVAFFCTDVDIDDLAGSFTYSYRLKPGINYDSHAIVSLPYHTGTLTDRKRPNWPACRTISLAWRATRSTRLTADSLRHHDHDNYILVTT